MFDELLNLNIETCSDSELKAWIKQIVPIVSVFLQASQNLLVRDSKPNTKSCESCTQRNSCITLCDDVNSLIPGEFSGTSNSTYKVGNLIEETSIEAEQPDRSSLRAIDKVRSDEIFSLYKNCLFLFTKKEWRVVTLKVQQEMTYKEIAKVLASSISNASDIFQRAKKKMQNHYLKKRSK